MKKYIYVFVAFIFSICTIMFSTSAFAKSAVSATDFKLTDMQGKTTTIKSLSGKSIILVFGRMGEMLCGNTYVSLTYLNSVLAKADDDSLCAYFMDIEESNSKEAIESNMVSMSNITPCYTSSGYNQQSWELYRKYNGRSSGSDNITLPMVFFINANGEICDYIDSSGISTEEWIDRIKSNFDITIDINSKSENAAGTCGKNVTWTYDGAGTLNIEGNGNMYWPLGYSIGIPWGDYVKDIEKVIIQDGVTAITDCAFYGCENLKSIEIPKSVTRIGSFAFAECSSLEEITIPDGVPVIDGWTFRNCSSLKNMYIPSSISAIGPAAFLNNPKEFNIYYEGSEAMWNKIDLGDKYIEDYDPNIYYNCSGIGKVTIIMTIGSKNALISGQEKINDVAPIIANNRTMLPARFIVENLGAKIEWIADEQKVKIENDETEIILYIGSDTAIVNNENIKLDSPAFIDNGRTYTPIRFISEALGAEVKWDSDSQSVTITNK